MCLQLTEKSLAAFTDLALCIFDRGFIIEKLDIVITSVTEFLRFGIILIFFLIQDIFSYV